VIPQGNNADVTGFQMDPRTRRILAPRGEVAYTESGGSKKKTNFSVDNYQGWRQSHEIMHCLFV